MPISATSKTLQAKLDRIAKDGYGEIKTTGIVRISEPLILHGQDYVRLVWTHIGGQIRVDRPGPFLTIVNGKNCELNGIQASQGDVVFKNGPGRPGLTPSSSTNIVNQCKWDDVLILEDKPGEDLCNFDIRNSQFRNVIVRGSNNLAHSFSNVFCSRGGFDLTKGGSTSAFYKCGGDDCEVLFNLNAGYQYVFSGGGRSERCGTIFKVSGGPTQGTGFSVSGREDVGVKNCWIDIDSPADFEFTACKLTGNLVVMLNNNSSARTARLDIWNLAGDRVLLPMNRDGFMVHYFDEV